MTREELQPEWERIVDIGFSDYENLTKAERVWFNVESLTTGGIVDHYINHGAEYNSDTIEDLETLNFTKVADMLRKMNTLFPNGKPSSDIDERAEQMSDWNETHEDFLEQIDADFWKRSKELEMQLYFYVNENNLGG